MGMTNNILSIKHRKSPDESKGGPGQQKRRPSYRVSVKGKTYAPKQVRSHVVNMLSWDVIFCVVFLQEMPFYLCVVLRLFFLSVSDDFPRSASSRRTILSPNQ